MSQITIGRSVLGFYWNQIMIGIYPTHDRDAIAGWHETGWIVCFGPFRFGWLRSRPRRGGRK